MLPVRELPRHRRAEDELCRADLDGIAEAPDRLAASQMSGDQAPHRLPVGLEEQADHLLDLGRRPAAPGSSLQVLPGLGKLGGHRHTGAS